MTAKKRERKSVIIDFIQRYFFANDRFPSEHDIVTDTGIPAASVHRLLVEMRENGELDYDGRRRSVRPSNLNNVSAKEIVPLVGNVACGLGEEETETVIEYFHLPVDMIGKGEHFVLIAKGESMVDVGVHPGDYVVVRKQLSAKPGELVIALRDGINNLKKLEQEDGKYILRSCNKERASDFPDIPIGEESELKIQGVAVGVYHYL